MTTKTLSTYIAAGYILAAQYDTLDITTTGGIGGTGLLLDHLATLDNDGVIHASGHDGVHVAAGGTIVNGSAAVTTASILGYSGVFAQNTAASVANYGTIQGVGAFGDGLFLTAGGAVTNGIASDVGASITGQNSGVSMDGAATVANFGTIAGDNGQGVYLKSGGSVTNGSSHDTRAAISGHAGQGVYAKSGAATVVNFGAIQSQQSDAIVLGDGGVVTNFGSIVGLDAHGVYLRSGGTVTNGSVKDTAALIEGRSGVECDGAGKVRNFGTIFGGSGISGPAGVGLGGNSSLTNGSTRDATALIQANAGVVASYNAVVTNYGTIVGTGGAAVQFNDASDILVVEAGCAFVGQVLGDGGTLNLDNGAGTLTGLMAGGSVTVSGSMAATTFTSFATLEIGAKARFATSGAVNLTAGQTVTVSGSLTLGGQGFAVANGGKLETLGGSLTVKGAVTGSGQTLIKGGTLDFTSTFNQTVTFVGGAGTLELAKSRTYGGTIFGFSKTGGTFLDLTDIAFTGAGEATYSGTKSGGVLTVTDGTHTAHIALNGNYLASTWVAASDGNGGVLIHDPTAGAGSAPPPGHPPGPGPSPHPFVAAMAGWAKPPGEAIHLGAAASPRSWTLAAPHALIA